MNQRITNIQKIKDCLHDLEDDELDVLARVTQRFLAGQRIHGRFDAYTDDRKRVLQAFNEAIDALFYRGAEWVKQTGIVAPQPLSSLSTDESAIVWHIIDRLRTHGPVYGQLDTSTDPRDFVAEAFEEACDGALELGMECVKRELRGNPAQESLSYPGEFGDA